jgi:hypothetical protein
MVFRLLGLKEIGLSRIFNHWPFGSAYHLGVSAANSKAAASTEIRRKKHFIRHLHNSKTITNDDSIQCCFPSRKKWMGLSEIVTGAWLGGTIDTTGAVVAAGTIAGETGLKYATIVKFSQNVLLGLAAFAISIFWAYRSRGSNEKGQHVPARIIWDRFPKFVLGFILASVVFSFILSPNGKRLRQDHQIIQHILVQPGLYQHRAGDQVC